MGCGAAEGLAGASIGKQPSDVSAICQLLPMCSMPALLLMQLPTGDMLLSLPTGCTVAVCCVAQAWSIPKLQSHFPKRHTADSAAPEALYPT